MCRAEEKIKKSIHELKEVLATHNSTVLAVSSPEQISRFIKVFEITLQKIASDKVPSKNERALGIANIVADQWPFDLELGSLVIEAEHAYKEI
ncbi:hypothetical protein [Serratia sp. 1D1416]|uniref:hypothetical protein n=1 Tax=Serratia sp. 1D1416 TaxID=2447890 RepID=UPI001013CE70|nr:hypothetical protein [Serratia sp. 1D1416]